MDATSGCGVYQIRNVINGKVYYGSSNDFQVRMQTHFWRLARGDHHNHHLQASYKRHGREAFVFEVVEECLGDDLLSREQVYLDIAMGDAKNHYNSAPVAGKPTPFESLPPEERERLRSLARTRNNDPVVKAAMSDRMRILHANPVFKANLVGRANNPAVKAAFADIMVAVNSDPDVKAAASGRMRALHRDPAFEARSAERLRVRNADPVFREKQAEAVRKMQADPGFKAANAERFRKVHADPIFKAEHAERMRQRNAEREATKAPLIARIFELGALGWTHTAIADAVGWTRSGVSRRLKTVRASVQ